jgi:hypothetical protein
MKVSEEKVEQGIINYFEHEIAAKATGFKKFASYFIVAAYKDKMHNVIDELLDNPMIEPLELKDENGHIDIDALYNYAKDAYHHSGQFIFEGIIFNENDIDKLFDYIKS